MVFPVVLSKKERAAFATTAAGCAFGRSSALPLARSDAPRSEPQGRSAVAGRLRGAERARCFMVAGSGRGGESQARSTSMLPSEPLRARAAVGFGSSASTALCASVALVNFLARSFLTRVDLGELFGESIGRAGRQWRGVSTRSF
jgi:hypothetical protein